MRSMLMLAAAMAALSGPAAAQSAGDLHAAVAADWDRNLSSLWSHFHANPELSGRETQTAARMAQELRALSYEVTEGVGGTGVVAVLRNGAGPTVLVRADMDGLPIREDPARPGASTVVQIDRDGVEKPVMHACGHDVHITALVGTARQMAARKDGWSGTLVLIAQPAEEITEGARAMLDDGLYTRFPKPDFALGFHVKSALPAGRIEIPDGIAYSSSDSVNVTVRGVGGHGAYPHLTIDPIVVASQIVMSLQTIRSREINPLEGAVVTVGSIHGGIKHNIIPDRVDMQLTLRADSPELRTQLMESVRRVAVNTARALDVPDNLLPTVEHEPGLGVPPTINDTALAHDIRDAIVAGMGADAIVTPPRGGMGAEDFAWYGAPETGVRAVYYNVGGTPEDRLADAPPHHSSLFTITPQPAVIAGVESMVLGAISLMPRR